MLYLSQEHLIIVSSNMKKILSILFILVLLIPTLSIDAKTKSSTSMSPSVSTKSSKSSTNSTKANTSNNNTYSRSYYRSRNYYGSFPWIWIILMDSDDEQVQAYCVPIADTNNDGIVEDSEVTDEYEDCVKQYSNVSILGVMLSILFIAFIFRVILNILRRRK